MRLQGWVVLSISLVLTCEIVTHQINEMAMVREKVYNMEQAHLAMKSKYGCSCVVLAKC
jgi:ABC-type transporter Mla maintaining outer membrane lipid asymmetry ATPase subunit MlaF